ncbi:MAG TPA: AMP-binding protein [Stellaceae bacterium]
MDDLARTAEARSWPAKELPDEAIGEEAASEQVISVAETDARTYLDARPHQRELLAQSVVRAFERTFFYGRLFRKHFRGKAITPELVRELFFGLPFTSKEDVVRNYPNGFLAVAPQVPVAYFESSGTSGNTIHSTRSASFFTHADVERDVARRFSPDLAVTSTDVVVNALPFALTSSGLGFMRATMAAGAMAVTVDSGSMLSSHVKHIELMKELKATVLITSLPFVYSTLLQMEGQDPKTELPNLRAIQLCGLATLRNGKAKIRSTFGVPVFDTYGLSEFGATTYTCRAGEMHVHDGDFFFEVINPRDGEPVGSGVGGEIVITTLTREGSPKIRYRTGDFGMLHYGRCACGRRVPRLEVKGRLRDAAQFGERFRLPIDFEEVVARFPATTGLFRLRYEPIEGEGNRIKVTVTADVDDPNRPGLRDEIQAALRAEIWPLIDVELVRVGGAQAALLDQSKFANVRTVKSAMLDDHRPQEWLVTY